MSSCSFCSALVDADAEDAARGAEGFAGSDASLRGAIGSAALGGALGTEGADDAARRGPEAVAAQPDARIHGVERNAELGGDVRRGDPFEVVHHERDALVEVERVEPARDELARGEDFEGTRRRRRARREIA